MSLETDIKTVLDADSGAGGVATLCTGGVISWQALGPQGVTPDTLAAANAYDPATNKLRPLVVVKEGNRSPTGQIMSDDAQKADWREVVGLWVYDDRDAGFSTIQTVITRLHTVCHGKRAGGLLMRYAFTLNPDRDPALDGACFMRYDVAVVGVQ